MADWKKAIFELSDVRILLYLREKGKTRYSELLASVVESRSTLATSLLDLQNMGFVKRQVKSTRPVQTAYVLTGKGNQTITLLVKIKEIIGARADGQ